MWRRFTTGKPLLVGVGLAIIGIVVVLPVVYLLVYTSAQGPGSFWNSMSSPEALFSLSFSIALASITTVINGAAGTAVAFMLVRHDPPFKGLVDSLVDLPLAIPASVTGFSLLLFYGPLGLLGGPLDDAGLKIAPAVPAVLIAHVFITLPFVVRAVAPALRDVDKSQEEAARMLGAGNLRVFTAVVLPGIKGGLIAGCVFTFSRSLGELGATIMVSGNIALMTQSAPLFIFSEFGKGNVEAATSMSAVLTLLSVALFAAFKLALRMVGGGPRVA